MGKLKLPQPLRNSSLNLENLPWTSDRESQVKVREYTVVHKDDLFEWFRPINVKMDEKTVWTLQKYLDDQDQYTQYTQGDMLVKLGHSPSPWSTSFSSNWWKNTRHPRNETPSTEPDRNKTTTTQQLSPIEIERTEKDVLRSNQHVCDEYKKVICIQESFEEDENPFVTMMGCGD